MTNLRLWQFPDRIAVMKKEKILQGGTSGELYMNPQSIFVAYFIGESNFLEGYVSKISGKVTIVELRGGIKVQAVNNKGVKEGEKVLLAVRPEIFVIGKGKRREKRHFRQNRKGNF